MTTPYNRFNNQQRGGLPASAPPEFLRGVPAPTTPPQAPAVEENPYAEFVNEDGTVKEEENPYAEFLTPETGALPEQPPAQGEIPAWQVPWEAGSNAIPSAANFFGGLWTSIVNPVDTANMATDLVGGIPLAMMPEGMQKAITKDNPTAQRMLDTAYNEADRLVNRFGSWKDIKETVATDPVGALADGSALVPAVSPLRPLNSAGRLAGHGVRGAVDHFDPQTKLVFNATEDRHHAVQRAADNPQTIIPGSTPTATQAIARMGGGPPLNVMALGHAATERAGSASRANQILEQQNNARVNVLRDEIGKTPAELAAARKAREDAARVNYAAAGVVRDDKNPIPIAPVYHRVDDELKGMLDNIPGLPSIFDRARESSAKNGIKFSEGETRPAQLIPGRAPTLDKAFLFEPDDVLGRRPTRQEPTPQAGPYLQVPEQRERISADGMHRVKMALDEEASTIGNVSGWDAQQVRDNRVVRDKVLKWFEEQNPAYKDAKDKYRQDSLKINQMEIGQELERILQDPVLKDATIDQKFGAFVRAVQESHTTNPLLRRFGKPRYNNLDEFMLPRHMEVINALQDDMGRAALAESLGKKGADFKKELGAPAKPVTAPPMINALFTTANAASRMLAGKVSEKVADNVTNAMHTPEGLSRLIQDALDSRDRVDMASLPFHIAGKQIAKFNKRGGIVYNALANEREERERKAK